MCITAGERAEEEEEDKICGQHFASSGGQLQRTKSGDSGSCLPAPALCCPPPCPGAALRPAAPSPDGKEHPNRSGGASYLERTEVSGAVCRGSDGRGALSSGAGHEAVSVSPQHHVPEGLTHRSPGITLRAHRQSQEPCSEGAGCY